MKDWLRTTAQGVRRSRKNAAQCTRILKSKLRSFVAGTLVALSLLVSLGIGTTISLIKRKGLGNKNKGGGGKWTR